MSTYEAGPRILETAKAREDAASLLNGAEAIAQLRAALATYETVGATGDITRVRSALRQRGINLGTRGPRQRPPTGWKSLTPAEQRVVALAAEGLTTRQIGDRLYISSFTVGSHLRHVYQKLGINSRVQLTKQAINHGAAAQLTTPHTFDPRNGALSPETSPRARRPETWSIGWGVVRRHEIVEAGDDDVEGGGGEVGAHPPGGRGRGTLTPGSTEFANHLLTRTTMRG